MAFAGTNLEGPCHPERSLEPRQRGESKSKDLNRHELISSLLVHLPILHHKLYML